MLFGCLGGRNAGVEGFQEDVVRTISLPHSETYYIFGTLFGPGTVTSCVQELARGRLVGLTVLIRTLELFTIIACTPIKDHKT
jgi:hypothetical protein